MRDMIKHTKPTLLTTDFDFNHLDGVFLNLDSIDIQPYLT